jgi:hypothetical protein
LRGSTGIKPASQPPDGSNPPGTSAEQYDQKHCDIGGDLRHRHGVVKQNCQMRYFAGPGQPTTCKLRYGVLALKPINQWRT